MGCYAEEDESGPNVGLRRSCAGLNVRACVCVCGRQTKLYRILAFCIQDVDMEL